MLLLFFGPADDVAAALQTAVSIAEDLFANHRRSSDSNEPVLDPSTSEVSVGPGIAEALAAFRDAGFFATGAAIEHGGAGLPCAVANALLSPFNGANVATTSYTFLTIAAANLLARYASKDQVQRYLLPMVEGRFFGTMNLSEPQAGSSLADIRTTATPSGDADGHYKVRAASCEWWRLLAGEMTHAGCIAAQVKGTKMWISGGEHSLSDSIVHLVLAKVPGGPPGVRGISLFIVPKHHIEADGSVGERNDVRCGGVNHKMGWRGTVNTVMNYGEDDQCRGYRTRSLA